jgi:hypothetical protein
MQRTIRRRDLTDYKHKITADLAWRTTVRFAGQIQTKTDTVIENSLYSTTLRALAHNPRTLFQATKSRLVST